MCFCCENFIKKKPKKKSEGIDNTEIFMTALFQTMKVRIENGVTRITRKFLLTGIYQNSPKYKLFNIILSIL